MDDKNYYSAVKVRLTVIFCLLITVPMVILALFTISNLKDAAIKKVELSLGRLVDHKKEVVSLFLKEKEDLLAMLVGMYPIEYLGHQENLNNLFRSLNQKGSIVDLHVIDSAGNQLAYVGPYAGSIVGKNYADAQWFQEVLIKGSHVSDIFLGFRNVPHFVVAVTDPLKTYVLRATINSEAFNNLLLSSLIGPNGDSFIVNRDGKLQTPSRQGVKELSAEDRSYLQHHEGTSIENNGITITATRWVKDGQWCLYVKTRIEDSLVPFYQTRNSVLIIIFLTGLAFLGLAALLANYFLHRLEAYDRKRTELGHQMGQMEKMASVGRLAAGIAHEINNPLQMITNQAGWIAELLPDEDPALVKNMDEYTKAIEQIRHHVRRAGTITHRLLGFSRKLSSEKQSVQMNELIEEAISFVEREAGYNNITIARDYREDLPTTMTDGPQLQQVFLNLLNNAIDAVGKGGRLEIRTAVDGEGRLVLEFADNGPGIKPENLKQIFDPFFTTKEPGKGTGLGLYITYDIVQKLGGTIKVENRKGGGAVFTIVLPVITLGSAR
ncbi:MAG: ATP-binding protein [Desulfoprunum sp.]|jgi:two-component system NtrC family sensor kinase|uniref:sensor histidine kinase n=1 Tax=Desulfoprunum sp. TaxID=2020866 RepID=UPI0006895DB0